MSFSPAANTHHALITHACNNYQSGHTCSVVDVVVTVAVVVVVVAVCTTSACRGVSYSDEKYFLRMSYYSPQHVTTRKQHTNPQRATGSKITG